MSIKYSYKAMYPSFAAMILVWMIYHIVLHLATRENPRPSSYRDEVTKKITLQKVLIPVRTKISTQNVYKRPYKFCNNDDL